MENVEILTSKLSAKPAMYNMKDTTPKSKFLKWWSGKSNLMKKTLSNPERE